ncbi:MAG TPA: hypothetical protein VJN92_08925 [Candidatus Acidoferrum sp.]|nr:hypothetical protein [Candidatus Acidoferrum sp.]
MNFDSLAKTVSSKVADVGAQKATETLDQANLLLKLLQDAGYQVGEVDVELGVPPAISVTLKTGPMLSDAKLNSIYEANKGNDALALVLNGVIQANKLRDKLKLETIELKDTKIVLKATPSISLHWRQKAAASAAAAS